MRRAEKKNPSGSTKGKCTKCVKNLLRPHQGRFVLEHSIRDGRCSILQLFCLLVFWGKNAATSFLGPYRLRIIKNHDQCSKLHYLGRTWIFTG